jgi:hypothetical protein
MDDWREYKRLILVMIDDNKKDHEQISKDLVSIKTEIALLKFKSGIWGGIAGISGAIIIKWIFSKVIA